VKKVFRALILIEGSSARNDSHHASHKYTEQGACADQGILLKSLGGDQSHL